MTEENTVTDYCALFESKAKGQPSSSKPVVGRMMRQKPAQASRPQLALPITKKAVKKDTTKMGIQTNDEQNTTEENTIRDRCALFESKATSQFSSSKPVVGRMMQQKPVQTGRAQPALSITKKAVKKVVIKTEQQADGKTTSQSKTTSQTSSSSLITSEITQQKPV